MELSYLTLYRSALCRIPGAEPVLFANVPIGNGHHGIISAVADYDTRCFVITISNDRGVSVTRVPFECGAGYSHRKDG